MHSTYAVLALDVLADADEGRQHLVHPLCQLPALALQPSPCFRVSVGENDPRGTLTLPLTFTLLLSLSLSLPFSLSLSLHSR